MADEYLRKQEAIHSGVNVVKLDDFRDLGQARVEAGRQLHAIGNILVGLLINFEDDADPVLNKLAIMSQDMLEQIGGVKKLM